MKDSGIISIFSVMTLFVALSTVFLGEEGQCNSLDDCYRCMTDKNKDPVCYHVWVKAVDICTEQARPFVESEYFTCLLQTGVTNLFKADSAACLNLCRPSCPPTLKGR